MPKKGDDLDYLTARNVLEHHGKYGAYEINSAQKEDFFVIDKDVELISDDFEGQTSILVTVVQYDSTLFIMERGGRIVIGIDVYVVDALLKNDGYLAQVSVVKQ